MFVQHSDGTWLREQHRAADLGAWHEVIEHDGYKLAELREFWTRPHPLHVLDVGAHIGCFSVHFHRMACKLGIPHGCVAVEACPENLGVLEKNVREFGHVVHGAMYYPASAGPEPRLTLANTVQPGTNCTSSSTVLVDGNPLKADYLDPAHARHWVDERPLTRVSVADVMGQRGWDYVSLLKLDCEGAEFSILENCDLSRIEFIVGEWHDRERWRELLSGKFFNWRFRSLGESRNSGMFWLDPSTFAGSTRLPR